jgi:hypothetical protein
MLTTDPYSRWAGGRHRSSIGPLVSASNTHEVAVGGHVPETMTMTMVVTMTMERLASRRHPTNCCNEA